MSSLLNFNNSWLVKHQKKNQSLLRQLKYRYLESPERFISEINKIVYKTVSSDSIFEVGPFGAAPPNPESGYPLIGLNYDEKNSFMCSTTGFAIFTDEIRLQAAEFEENEWPFKENEMTFEVACQILPLFRYADHETLLLLRLTCRAFKRVVDEFFIRIDFAIPRYENFGYPFTFSNTYEILLDEHADEFELECHFTNLIDY